MVHGCADADVKPPSEPDSADARAANGAEADAMADGRPGLARNRLSTASSAPQMECEAEPTNLGQQHLSRWTRLKNFKPLGLEPTPELAAIAVAYFVQGMKTQVADLAEKYLMKDDLHMNPAQMDLWFALAHVPWMIKPLYGFVTDTYPVWGMRRRPYLVFCGLCGSVAFAALGAMAAGAGVALALMAGGELAIAFSDVVIDGVVVERSRGEALATAGALQSLCWGSQAVGSLSSAYGSGWLISRLGPRPVLGALGAFPLLICATAFLIREAPEPPAATKKDEGVDSRRPGARETELAARGGVPKAEGLGAEGPDVGYAGREGWQHPSDEEEAAPLVPGLEREDGTGAHGCGRLAHQLHMLARAMLAPAILLPATFVFCWNATPIPRAAMFTFYTVQLRFSPEFLGRMQLMDGTAQLIGVFVFNRFLRRVELRLIFLWIALIGAGAGLTQLLLVTSANRALGIGDAWFALVDSALLTGLARIALMPTLVMAARICPEGVEATLYAALMSVSNAGTNLGETLGAALTQALGVTATSFANLPWLSLLCTLSGLAVLPLLRLVPRSL